MKNLSDIHNFDLEEAVNQRLENCQNGCETCMSPCTNIVQRMFWGSNKTKTYIDCNMKVKAANRWALDLFNLEIGGHIADFMEPNAYDTSLPFIRQTIDDGVASVNPVRLMLSNYKFKEWTVLRTPDIVGNKILGYFTTGIVIN